MISPVMCCCNTQVVVVQMTSPFMLCRNMQVVVVKMTSPLTLCRNTQVVVVQMTSAHQILVVWTATITRELSTLAGAD